MSVKHIPEGYHSITPLLMVKNAAGFIEFLSKAFNGKQKSRHDSPDGKIMHAEVVIGDSIIMLGDATDKYPAMPGMLYLYVEDVDVTYKHALLAGGKSLREPTDEFYGDRSSGIADEFGNQWWIATHVEDVSPEEMKRREEEFFQKQK